jgi:hypothetical protein
MYGAATDVNGWMYLVSRKLDVSNNGPADEAALDGEHVRVLLGVSDADVGQLKPRK